MEKIYKEASRKPGVYKLTNKVDGKFYIGSCKEFKERWKHHERRLMLGEHHNKKLQHAFNLYGTNAFIFEVLEIIEGDKQLRLDAEQFLLNQHYDAGKQCYNLNKYAQTQEGRPFSSNPEKTKQKLSQTIKTIWANRTLKEKEKIGNKISSKNRGRRLTEEHVKKLRLASTGRRHTEKAKRKMSDAAKGRIFTEEHKRNLSKANTGKKLSAETKKKMSEARKGHKVSKETRQKLSKAHKGKRKLRKVISINEN